MGIRNLRFALGIFVVCILLPEGCKMMYDNSIPLSDRFPVISPDYINVTIPPNIAPMNFIVTEKGNSFLIRAIAGDTQIDIKSSDGDIRFTERTWKKLISSSKGDSISFQVFTTDGKTSSRYKSFNMYLAEEPVDPYLVYRLINPGYYNWSHIRIMQRSLEGFREEALVDNQNLEMNCINCHSFNQYNPAKFMVHIRGSRGGTYIADDGKITKRDPKVESMPGGATYPSWHPGGRFIAYSSNQVRQAFYAKPEKIIEVFDLVSAMIVFDIDNNEILHARDGDTTRYLETFPSWSPDGKYLYFCRAMQNNSKETMTMEEIEATKYDIVRIPFEPETRTFGNTEVVFNASGEGRSASFPRISPDGRYMVITVHDFGTFPIWHREADLHLIDLKTGESRKMDLNSDETESYHTWS